jgi:Outer membrane protein beta-barrel domain
MMKKLMIAAVLAAAGGAASAQGYAGALIGMANISTDCSAGSTCDDSDTGYKFYGGYEVAPNISVEVGYTSLGEVSIKGAQTGSIKGTAFSLVGAYRMSFNPELTGVVRLGLASVKGKLTLNGTSTSDSNIKLYTGLGVEYTMSPEIKLVGAFDLTNVEINGNSGTAWLLGAGAQVGF